MTDSNIQELYEFSIARGYKFNDIDEFERAICKHFCVCDSFYAPWDEAIDVIANLEL